MARDDNMIAALKRERANYVAQGKKDRVRLVDEQLRHHGYTGDETDENAGPQGRTEVPQQTADAGTPQPSGAAGTSAPAKKTAAAKKAATAPTKTE